MSDENLTREMGIALDVLKSQVTFNEKVMEMAAPDNWPGDPQVSHFSDTILISASGDPHGKRAIESALRSLLFHLLHLGFLTRGAVTIGPMFHRGSLAYGPALVHAYKLEREAIYPRIVLDGTLIDTLGRGEKYSDRDGNLIGYKTEWRRDADGIYFFDFLQPLFHFPGHEVNYHRYEAQMVVAKELIINNLQSFKTNAHIYWKYHWAAQYFNSLLDEFPDTSIEKIEIPV